MTRSIRAALALALCALALPTAALAASHGHPPARPVVVFGASVAGYSGASLTLALNTGGTVAGAVTAQTRFVCLPNPPSPGGGPPPPAAPCDSTRLGFGAPVAAALVQSLPSGMTFRLLVLLPAPPAPLPG